MKKLFSLILALVLCMSLLTLSVSAADPTASLTGPATVRSGDTITLTLNVSGTGILGLEGTISYDNTQVTLVKDSDKNLVGDPWDLDVNYNNNRFLAYENGDQDQPINSAKNVFSVSIRVGQLPVGTQVTISVADLLVSDGTNESALPAATYTFTVVAPKSSDNTLKKLTVNNATISPAFSPNVTSYTASVPYSVSKLDLNVVANDSTASVSINNPALTPESTSLVVITVTAENGAKKYYTITVTRGKDPNYVASGDNSLASITAEDFRLSPLFNKDVTSYIIWLPYETENVKVTAKASHAKATVQVEGGSNLIAGADNEIRIICTAENGDQKVYTVIAKRAPAHGSETKPTDPPVPTIPDTDPSTAPSAPQPPTGSVPGTSTDASTGVQNSAPSKPDNHDDVSKDNGSSFLLTVIYCIIGLIAGCGILVCLLFVIGFTRRRRN